MIRPAPEPRFTTDAFHLGEFCVVQPEKAAHRSGVDAMLLAACVCDGGAMRIADFGAGAGAAGLAVAARCKSATVTLIERNRLMLECATRTLALSENATIAGRCEIVDADIMELKFGKGDERLPPNHFDWVIMNPPFNAPEDRQSPHETRAQAHIRDADLFEQWIRKAASLLHAKGRIALIARPESLQAILSACDRRFGGLNITPVHPRSTLDAIRILVTAQKGNRRRLTVNAALTLHATIGSHALTDEANALINGEKALCEIRAGI